MPIPDGALADAKAYLRVETADEDSLIGQLVGAGLALCARFTGATPLLAAQTATLSARETGWIRLPATPVTAITAVVAVDLAGVETPLPVGAYAIDIDAAGDGWVRLAAPITQHRLAVRYTAGLAADWPSLPEPLRLGVVRLVAHLHAHRDAADDPGPPAAVAALWRPWRRMQLA